MNELHAQIITAVEQRHPRGDMTIMQQLRLGLAKLIEEAGEARSVITMPGGLALDMDYATAEARRLFREREWLERAWAHHPIDGNDDLTAFRAELTDTYIVLVHLAWLVAEVTGKPFDIEAAALAKATADLTRA